MFKRLVEVVRQMLFLLKDVEQNKEDLATLKEQLAETNESLRGLAFELQRVREADVHEREKLMLKIENILLRFERQLPPAKDSKKVK